MPTELSRHALIIGAGIGGLAAGIALRHAGVEVDVFEQADGPRDAGAGISLWANAIHALKALGLQRSIECASLTYAAGGLRSWRGTILASLPVDELQRLFQPPVIVMHRADLLAALLEAFGKARVHTAARCVAIHQNEGEVTAVFADGRHVQGDLLIGADGLHSVVRAQLHGARRPRYAGCTAWRAVVPFDAQTVLPGESWGRGSVFGQVPMPALRERRESNGPGGRVYWYATRNAPEGGRSPDEKAELRRLFRGWHEPIAALIEAADPATILRNDIYDRPILDVWGQGRATLLGDAAHPMMPFLGQGGCQALEDAVVLGTCLRESGDVPAALREYEARRVPRANRFVWMSRRAGRIAQLQNPLAVALRNRLVSLVNPSAQARRLARLIEPRF
jgi:2-polyprenyl-6-methoxyphenol hydroxylase-like FAD-dependent oxidoreductase